MDFTLKTYRKLLEALMGQDYNFQPFAEFLEYPVQRTIILRHDVEARYENALQFARIQSELNVTGTYYFRLLPNHFDKEIIREISALGHEIGYHYDDLSHCKGNYEAAIKRFEKNLATLRKISPVKTICMEGAPLSKWDNRDLWRHGGMGAGRHGGMEAWRHGCGEAGKRGSREAGPSHASRLTLHYHDYGLTGEPYFDLDFSKVLYLTDTGRRWDGVGSIRDKIVQSSKFKVQSEVESVLVDSDLSVDTSSQSTIGTWNSGTLEPVFRRTADIIAAANNGLLPDQIMLTFHPQRWTDKPLPWMQELVLQNVKNVAKRWMVGRRA